jgi:hypothetical protein
MTASARGLVRARPDDRVNTACYDAEFNFYGVIGEPRRVDCPADAEPVVRIGRRRGSAATPAGG